MAQVIDVYANGVVRVLFNGDDRPPQQGLSESPQDLFDIPALTMPVSNYKGVHVGHKMKGYRVDQIFENGIAVVSMPQNAIRRFFINNSEERVFKKMDLDTGEILENISCGNILD